MMRVSDELSRLSIPDDVKTVALTIYSNLTKRNGRADNRTKVICYCIYQAYLDVRNPQDVILIGRELGLSPSDSDSCLLISRKLKNANIHHTGFISIPDLIRCYSQEKVLNFTDEATQEILDMWNRLSEKSPQIHEKRPRHIVSALIWLYIKRHDPSREISSEFCSIFGLQRHIVESMYESLITLEI